MDVEGGVRGTSPNLVHLIYKNKKIQLESINKSFQLSLCIVSFIILFKCMVYPRLYPKGIFEFFLAVQKFK